MNNANRGFLILTEPADRIAAIEIAADGTIRTAPTVRDSDGALAQDWSQARTVTLSELVDDLRAQPDAASG